MGAAKTEEEVLTHMGICFERSGGLIGPASESSWSDEKAHALTCLELETGAPGSVADVGIGDLTPMERWAALRGGWPDRYVGFDGCMQVLDRAMQRYYPNAPTGPQKYFARTSFAELVAVDYRYDYVVMCDVLYHMPDADLCRQLFDWAFARARKGVLLTYATKHQEFGGLRPGDAGFAWFPRPEVSDWIWELTGGDDPEEIPPPWRLVYQTSNFKAGPQQQKLVALARRESN